MGVSTPVDLALHFCRTIRHPVSVHGATWTQVVLFHPLPPLVDLSFLPELTIRSSVAGVFVANYALAFL